ncbi:hypothetical protein [Paenirhodobacter populi]|uniref:hypothetical protein n=1 Tax=Paenirhodobacter populi TaxID=2306993 RepID=UPI0013E3FDC3|nr:hypothetical protein [Sinirhodobacter populi]
MSEHDMDIMWLRVDLSAKLHKRHHRLMSVEVGVIGLVADAPSAPIVTPRMGLPRRV